MFATADEIDAVPFEWPVARGGYRWVTATAQGEDGRERKDRLFLSHCIPATREAEADTYGVFAEHDALFRTFASTPLSETGIASFANQFGLLGGFHADGTHARNITTKDGIETIGEPRQLWVRAIREMNEAVLAWDAVRRGDSRALTRRIKWDIESMCVEFDSHPHAGATRPGDWDFHVRRVIASWDETPDVFGRLRANDVIGPAREFVAEAITSHLRDLQVRLTTDRMSGEISAHLVPTNLLTALWMQFAAAVHGMKNYRSCKGCGRPFEVSIRRSRRNKLYCADACKSDTYRKRKEEAARLHRSGVGVREIASALGSEPAIVRGWIRASNDSTSPRTTRKHSRRRSTPRAPE